MVLWDIVIRRGLIWLENSKKFESKSQWSWFLCNWSDLICLSYSNPEPKAVFFTCMDSRMIPTRFTWVFVIKSCLIPYKISRLFTSDTHVGDMFVIRNAGNLVPHSQFFQDEHYSCEPAGLELGASSTIFDTSSCAVTATAKPWIFFISFRILNSHHVTIESCHH